MKIKRAIISVSDKANITVLAKGLEALGVEIISSGGTAAFLKKEGISVKEVSEITKHTKTNIYVTKKFLECTFTIDEEQQIISV